MTQIDRQELEKPTPLDEATLMVDSFLNDTTSYPDEDVRLRRGICKVLAEEYMPLVLLAKVLPNVESVRLFPASNQGPDGELRFSNQSAWKVQITCSHEGYQRALMREQLQQNGVAIGGQRSRDTSGSIICNPSVLPPNEEVEARLNRIRSAVQAKECNFHKDTDTLIVLEANARHLQRYKLHERVVEALCGRPSNYERIYMIYGSDVRMAKPEHDNGSNTDHNRAAL
jgi:hypothetical protein